VLEHQISIKTIKAISFCALLVTIVITPWWSVDAFTPIKFAVTLLGTTIVIVAYGSGPIRAIIFSKYQRVLYISFLFTVTASAFRSPKGLSASFFGSTERLLGLGSVLSLGTLMFIVFNTTRQVNRSDLLKVVLSSIRVSNILVVGLFFFQLNGFGVERFDNIYAVPVSTLGNPNFLACFIAMSSIAWIPKLISDRESIYSKSGTLLILMISLYGMTRSSSLQGILLFAAGLVCFSLLVLIHSKKLSVAKIGTSVLALLIILVIAFSKIETLQLNSLLYQQTLQLRILYWKIAVRMLLEQPYFGWGFSSYFDNFRIFQSEQEYMSFGAGVVSDSAHNYFLDFAVVGGLSLAIFFGIILIIMIRAVYLYIWRSINPKEAESSQIEFTLVSLVVVFVMQSLINPFNMAIAFWGTVILGCTLSLGSNVVEKGVRFKEKRIEQKKRKYSPVIIGVIKLFVCLLLSPTFAIKAYRTDHDFRSAAETGNLGQLVNVALESPISYYRFNAITSELLRESDIPDYLRTSANTVPPDQLKQIVLDLSYKMIEVNQQHLVAWINVYRTEKSLYKREKALRKIRDLDPHNPQWKASQP